MSANNHRRPSTSSISLILLAAGIGSRLTPYSRWLPKCLMPIHNNCLMDYWFDLVSKSSISEIRLNCHAHKKLVQSYLSGIESRFKKSVVIFHEPTLLGPTLGVAGMLETVKQDIVVIAHADNFTDLNFDDLIYFFEDSISSCGENAIGVVSFEVNQTAEVGVFALSPDGKCIDYFEKIDRAPSTIANGAIYILKAAHAKRIFAGEINNVELAPFLFFRLLEAVRLYMHDGYLIDIGTEERLLQANRKAEVCSRVVSRFGNKEFYRSEGFMKVSRKLKNRGELISHGR